MIQPPESDPPAATSADETDGGPDAAEVEQATVGYDQWVADGCPGALSHDEIAAALLRGAPDLLAEDGAQLRAACGRPQPPERNRLDLS
jgi:hypothetical protein